MTARNCRPHGRIYPASPRRRKVIRLREAGWLSACESRGITGDTALGSLLGYHATFVYRVRTGRSAPSNEFIATACDSFGCKFDDLFEIVDPLEVAAEEAS